jgi:23S rRNA (adenine2503-C2)-methyltransferase
MTPCLHDLSPEELEDLLVVMGEPPYRGRQLAHGLYQRRVRSIEELSDLPLQLRMRLASEHGLTQLRQVGQSPAGDGTVKHLFELWDRQRIESVSIEMEKGRRTFCLSTQLGCRMACVFCATARMGLRRQLSPGEIVAQVLALGRMHPTSRQPNLVFMGMGEPLDNFDNLQSALRILSHRKGLDIGARHITISTSGPLEGMRRLQELERPYGLALSLTTASPAGRRRLMPVAGSEATQEIVALAAEHGRRTARRVTLECVLIAGENDGQEDARALANLARRGPFKVNLIPLNEIEGFSGKRPSPERVKEFADRLWSAGIVCTVRDSAGREVAAACGQLVQRRNRSTPPSSHS